MRVYVKRVSAMPHNVRVWVDDERPDMRIVLMDKILISEEGARLVESALNAANETTRSSLRPLLRLHTQAG